MTYPSFTCNHCGRISYNLNDQEYQYCGWCHHYCQDYDFWRSESKSMSIWARRYVAARNMITVHCPLLETSDED